MTSNDDTQAARRFHDATKYLEVPEDVHPQRFAMGTLPNVENAIWQEDWSIEPYPYKVYEDLPGIDIGFALPSMEMPRDLPEGAMPSLDAIAAYGDEPQGERVPDRDALARIATLSNGFLKEGAHRPDGTRIEYRTSGGTGARYHLEEYFITGEIEGLAAGIYHYSAQDQTFRQLRAGDYRAVLVEATGAEPSIAAAPVIMAMTSTFWRNAWRYKGRAYRHAFWDAATTTTNALAVAASLDLTTAVVFGFVDDAVNALLGIDGEREATLTLTAIGRGGPTPAPVAEVAPIDHRVRPVSAREVTFPIIGETHRASSLARGHEVAAWRAHPLLREEPEITGPLVPLRPAAVASPAPMPIEDLIRRRRSTRHFDTGVALDFGSFSTLVDVSTRGFATDALPKGALPLHEQYLIVHAVEGLEPGVYKVHPRRRAIELVTAGLFREQSTRLAAMQEYAGAAHVNSYGLADLDAVLGAYGNRGYRVAQFEAALYGSRLHLATHAVGLGAVGSTSFDDEVVEFLTPGRPEMAYCFVFVFGKRRKQARG
jgi:SagB-type dehydrogenase family enzyme